MAKIKGPLYSLDARGNLARGAMQFRGGLRGVHAYRPVPPGQYQPGPSEAQLSHRALYGAAVQAWRALTPEERDAWNQTAAASARPVSGWNLFVEDQLKQLSGVEMNKLFDPHWNETYLLVPFNTLDPVDVSNNHSLTRMSNPVSSISQQKFYGRSMYFDGINDSIRLPMQQALYLNGQNWTIEAWVYMTSAVVEYYRAVIAARDGGPSWGFVVRDNIATFEWWANGNYMSVSSLIGGNSLNNWRHVMACRNGNDLYVGYDGASNQGAMQPIDETANYAHIGSTGFNTRYWAGYMQDLRITMASKYVGESYEVPDRAVWGWPIDQATHDFYVEPIE